MLALSITSLFMYSFDFISVQFAIKQCVSTSIQIRFVMACICHGHIINMNNHRTCENNFSWIHRDQNQRPSPLAKRLASIKATNALTKGSLAQGDVIVMCTVYMHFHGQLTCEKILNSCLWIKYDRYFCQLQQVLSNTALYEVATYMYMYTNTSFTGIV